jgi:hypothetical protein
VGDGVGGCGVPILANTYDRSRGFSMTWVIDNTIRCCSHHRSTRGAPSSVAMILNLFVSTADRGLFGLRHSPVRSAVGPRFKKKRKISMTCGVVFWHSSSPSFLAFRPSSTLRANNECRTRVFRSTKTFCSSEVVRATSVGPECSHLRVRRAHLASTNVRACSASSSASEMILSCSWWFILSKVAQC